MTAGGGKLHFRSSACLETKNNVNLLFLPQDGDVIKACLDVPGMKPRCICHSTLVGFPDLHVMAVINKKDEVLDVSNATYLDQGGNISDDNDLDSNHNSDVNESSSDSDQGKEEDSKQQDKPENY